MNKEGNINFIKFNVNFIKFYKFSVTGSILNAI